MTDDAGVGQARIDVRLQPRARSDEIVGVRDGTLLVRVTAPPLAGRANRALCSLIAKRLRVAPSRVTVIRGERARRKLVAVEGMDQGSAVAALGLTEEG
jgi:uncharacterized protein (TIGR00251 family)